MRNEVRAMASMVANVGPSVMMHNKRRFYEDYIYVSG